MLVIHNCGSDDLDHTLELQDSNTGSLCFLDRRLIPSGGTGSTSIRVRGNPNLRVRPWKRRNSGREEEARQADNATAKVPRTKSV